MSIVSISCLGSFGRFGNQLFQYAFAKAYADRHGSILQTPAWVGQKLFEHINDPPITKQLPKTSVDNVPWGKVDIDLFGYFQFKECFDYYSLTWLRQLFQFGHRWLLMFPKEGQYVAAHRRSGDYLTKHQRVYCTVKEESFIRAYREFNLDNQRLIWVSEERPNTDDRLTTDVSFLKDFMILMNADVLLRSNSTFSWWAGTLGSGAVYSPIVGDHLGLSDVPFVKGNYPRFLHPHYCRGTSAPPCDLHIRE